MCGITGWIDYHRDLATERPTVELMTEAIASRGVDDHGLWLRGHACLGHTRTAVIDPAGGAQPMIADEDGSPTAVLAYSGEIFNFQQLRTELRERGHKFRTRSDTEVVLRSYLEWGVRCAERLEGMFAFAVWDLRTEELVLIRDRMGIKPLFYAKIPGGFIFGSEPKALLAHPAIRPTVDLDGLREIFSTAKRPGAAVFRDMQELRAGHTLTVSRKGLYEQTYWKLEAKPHEEDLDGTIAHVRSLLSDIVLRELVADVPLCVGLSGGLDSSAITALAAQWMWKLGGDRVRTVTHAFEGYEENFRPDDVRDTPDGPFAAEMAALVRSDHTDLMIRTADLMDPETRRAVLLAQDMPSTLGDMDTSHYLMLKSVRDHSTVMLTGEVGDEVFCGFRWMFDPDFTNSGTFPWVANENKMRSTGHGRGLFDQGLFSRKLDMATYYADNYQQTIDETPHQEGENGLEHKMREICYAHFTRWLPMLLARGDRLAMAHGLETRIPYCDHRLIEYLYNTPWAFKTFDGREKSLLRAAVGDLLPKSIVERRKSPWPVTQDPAYTEALHREFAGVLADPSSPVLPLLDLKASKETAANPTGSAHEWQSRINVETALQFNAWLRHYKVDLAI
ncbi:asparagine synthase (glutamine-hydrolyzing) [Amycolatopsis regifaucium]|uniref:asparagine synthase (glutamine-hydrolyzing) n=1 Tax=Amycolatopsis regifaucium TaxID=546365 RepID=A0A154MX64_9PSEU|nr:asparagine synthetase B [Amycolatopsis regifaucium]OKA11448.1 asparagine synthase (glutamine-hydrolyzing) [Amycolatopsis regifaucium]SFH41542.1 asparagine synthase (glutamine-hydrolysing) [Amycolatopsis regifaucium]